MRSFIHTLLIVSVVVLSSCVKEQYKGSGKYKRDKESEKNDNYLEKQSGKVVEKSEKRNKKEEKKKLAENKKAKEEEVEKNEAAKKKKKKRNTGKFNFY